VYIRTFLTMIIVFAQFCGCSVWNTSCLVIVNPESGRVMARLPVSPHESIAFEFVNSIYRAPVRETLMYRPPDGLFVVMVESSSEDVFRYYGLEANSTGKAILYRKVEKVRLRSSDYSSHRIKAGHHILYLKGVVPDGEPAFLDVRDCAYR